MSSSNVRLASSIIAHSSPRISIPWPANRAGSTSRGSLPSSVEPERVARRRAGSIVTTATRGPSAARPIAIAADVVVLPTPPEPAQMTTRLPSQAVAHSAPSSSVASLLRARRDRATAEAGTAAWGPARGRARRRRRSCDALDLRAACIARAARTGGAPGGGGGERLAPRRRVKRWAQHGVDDDAAGDVSRRLACTASCSSSASLTGISSGRATATTPVRAGSAEHRVDRTALPRDRAHARHARRTSPAPSASATPWPVAGASRIDEVVGIGARACAARAGRAPRPCRSSAARACRASRRRKANIRLPPSMSARRRAAAASARYSSRVLGVDRERAGRRRARASRRRCRRAARETSSRPRDLGARSSAARGARPPGRARRRRSTCPTPPLPVTTIRSRRPAGAVGIPTADGWMPPARVEDRPRDRCEYESPRPHEAPRAHKAKVIAFANQKGGVAKTTTTLNLAVAFAEEGHRVLCVDMDPQGNLTMSQGIDPDSLEQSMYDVLVHDLSIREVIRRREVDVACASIDLAGAEIAMSTKIGRERSLRQGAARRSRDDYDFICIDTPPSLGLLTINALTAADKVIVPVQCEYLSMRGLDPAPEHARDDPREPQSGRRRSRASCPTMVDTRTLHAKEAIEILEENFGDRVFASRIRKTVRFAEAPVKGMSVLKYDPERPGGRRLSPAGEGGARTWQAVSARACGKGRWPPCSARRETDGACSAGRVAACARRRRRRPPRRRRPRAAEHARLASAAAARRRAPDAAGAPAPRVLLRHPRRHDRAAAARRRGRSRRRAAFAARPQPTGQPQSARRRRRRRRRQRRQPHDRGRGRRRRVPRDQHRRCSRCSSRPRT